ncbi:MAG: hypothetical protein GEV05_24910 [Betaproteobacteria bacterium]|nr:hypothetical protein [Betaproteobacteria bacterium]
MTKSAFALVLSATLIGSAAFAEVKKTQQETIEARLERIEQAIARLDRKVSSGDGASMMTGGCPMMNGMMGGKDKLKDRSPNSQWQDSPAR